MAKETDIMQTVVKDNRWKHEIAIKAPMMQCADDVMGFSEMNEVKAK